MRGLAKLLSHGQFEPFKAAVHGLALGVAGLCAAYNFAAWLLRRERHLGLNTLIYSTAVWWEWGHIQRHLAASAEEAPGLAAPAGSTRAHSVSPSPAAGDPEAAPSRAGAA